MVGSFVLHCRRLLAAWVVGLCAQTALAESRFRPHIDGKIRRLTVVPGADHFFHDLYGEDAGEAILAFLREARGG